MLGIRRFDAWWVVAALVAAFESGVLLLGGRAVLWWSDLGMAATAALAAALLARRARHSTGTMRLTWGYVAASSAAWCVGQLVWSWTQLSGRDALPFPSLADVPYLLSVVLAAVAAVMSLHKQGAGRSRALFDALLGGVGTAAAAWALLLATSPDVLDDAPLTNVIALGYPVGYVAIAALFAVSAVRSVRHEARSLLALGCGWAVLGAANLVYAWLVLQGRYATGHWIDFTWVAAFGVLAATAVRPPVGRVLRRSEMGRLAVAMPYVPVLVAAGTIIGGRVALDAVLTSLCLAVLAVLGFRQYVTLVENQALTRDLERRVIERTAELATSEARFRRALAGGGVGSFEVDTASGRVFWSKEAQAIHGVQPGRYAATIEGAIAFTHPDDVPLLEERLGTVGEWTETTLEYRIRRADGIERWVEVRAQARKDGERHLITGILADVTDRRAAEAELDRLAHTDALTGLPNRTWLLEVLDAALQSREPLALLVMDLDGFKEVNDGLGHDTGDRVLVEVAERLRTGVRPSDLVARLGGDEFAIVLRGSRDPVAAGIQVSEHLLARLGTPVEVAGLRLPVAASVGIATAPGHGFDPGDLLRHADVAMYRAKQRGGTWAVFGEGDDRDRAGRLSLLADLRAAIADGKIDVHYQPQVDMRTGRVVAVEALARWNHPERGPVSPTEFIPLAEHSGLIRDLTPLVLRQALEQCGRWRAEGFDLQVGVNISPRLLHEPELAARIDRALLEARVPPGALTVEITEGAFADEAPSVERTLADLRRIGVRLSVDDFGTGYSSLAYLKRFPVDDVKIDRSFIAGLPGHADEGIVRAVLELARHLGVAVVAEGVEDAETYELLAGWGCTMAQGYWIARPQPAAALTAWLAEREPANA